MRILSQGDTYTPRWPLHTPRTLCIIIGEGKTSMPDSLHRAVVALANKALTIKKAVYSEGNTAKYGGHKNDSAYYIRSVNMLLDKIIAKSKVLQLRVRRNELKRWINYIQQ